MERLRAFGRWPREGPPSKSRDAALEGKLAHDLRKALATGFLSKAAEAEIDEMHWMHLRELEAAALEAKTTAQETRRQAARARKERLRALLALLRTSGLRCDCHDFAHWYGLWRCDPQLSTRLRLAGHHFRHCRLVRAAKQPGHHPQLLVSTDDEYESADSDDSDSAEADPFHQDRFEDGDVWDPDYGTDTDLDPYGSSAFVSAGLLAACKDCGSAIVCGVLESGLRGLKEVHHGMVTFLHRCERDPKKLDILGRGWEGRMVPYAVTPGSDVGMTSADYTWLLHECNIASKKIVTVKQ